MALHPQIQPLVDLVNAGAAEGPPPEEQTVEMRREGYHGLVALVPDGPEMKSVQAAEAPGRAGAIPLRVYQPTTRSDGEGGVVVFYHGGGWCIGDLDTHDEVCRKIAHDGEVVVVAVDYRLAPEAPYPAAVDDSWAALQWVSNNVGSLVGRDSAPISVCGDSAGGNLAAIMAVMARDAGQDLASQLLVYPAVDFRDPSIYPSHTDNAEGYVLTREGMDWFEGHYDPARDQWNASVITADLAGVAPAVIITAEYDPLRDEGEAYAAKLEDAGVDVSSTRYDGMVHIFFQLGPVVEPAANAVRQISTAAKRYSY